MKRWTSLLVALLLLLQLAPLTALPVSAQEQTAKVTWINPLYADFIDESDLQAAEEAAPAARAATRAATVNEAAVELRDEMLKRNSTTAEITLYTSGSSTPLETSKALCKEIFSAALEHTGAGTEGDYLRWQLGGYTADLAYNAGGTMYKFIYHITFFTTASEENYVTSRVTSILSGLGLAGKTEEQKIRAIYNFLCTSITYDYDRINEDISHTAFAALRDGKAVCQGYAVLLYRMMLDAGISCRVITGKGYNGAWEDHAWNIVRIGSLYYNVDATWDTPYYAVYHDYDYYLRCNANFADHVRNSSTSSLQLDYTSAEFNAAYPMSPTDYSGGSSTTYYTVTFMTEHGTAPSKQSVESGKTATKPADPTASGWKFEYWCKDVSLKYKYDFSTPVTLNITLYAKWTRTSSSPFEDVSEDDWFYKAVMWATTQSPAITNGTDATHFAPGNKCTRAEVVQFLYNAAGKPAVVMTINPFEDVSKDDWFYTAVMWAVSNKITNGTDESHFSPAKKCTRAEVVTFLRNAAGRPDPASAVNPFEDIYIDDWYYSSVLWAVGRGITSGTDATHFAPGNKCTRAEVVQFIYKYKTA